MKESTTPAGNPHAATIPYLTAKICIGTCKGPICYNLRQSSFHRSEIPEEKKKRVEAVNQWSKSKILSSSHNWNKSTVNLNPLVESRTMENFTNDRSKAFAFNFRAESLDPLRMQEPIDKPTKFHISRTSLSTANLNMTRKLQDSIQQGTLRRTEEIPVNVSLADKVEWNTMTSYSIRDKDRKLQELTNNSRAFTAKVSKSITRIGYIDPVKTEELYLNTLRESKSNKNFVPISRKMDEIVDPGPKKNLFAIEKPTRYSTSQHSGVWEFNKIEKQHMWSDTGSLFRDSQGDIKKIHNPEKRFYVGPETSPPRSSSNSMRPIVKIGDGIGSGSRPSTSYN